MKKGLLFISVILLVSFVAVLSLGITTSAGDNNTAVGNHVELNSEEVCCSITVVYPNAVPSYDMLKKSECDDVADNGETILGAHKEIVNESFCKETEEEDIEPKIQAKNSFCGSSTKANCSADTDCIVGGCSNQVCQGKNEEPSVTTCEFADCYNAQTFNISCHCITNKCMWSKLTESQIKNIIQARNRLKFENRTTIPCPTSCICTGSTMKCTLLNGREMTIFAGKSGNIIVQVKGENMTTNVTLYKSPDGKVYGTFKNNETKIVKMLPDQVRERIKEKIKARLENENISLDENGTYQYRAEKKARLFLIIPVRMKVIAEIDPETGEIIKISKPKWWGFLARNEAEKELIGASCGTVTPGENDNCCKSKGYDVWNAETNQCEFLS